MIRRWLIILLFTTGLCTHTGAQKHLNRQLDSLEKEFRKLDSIHADLEIKSADLEEMIRNQEHDLDQAEAEFQEEMEDKTESSYLSILMTSAIVVIFILGMVWLLKNQRSKKT